MNIAMISEHATDPRLLRLAEGVAYLGHPVRVYTRGNGSARPRRRTAAAGVTVVHVPVGPPERMSGGELPAQMVPFGQWLAAAWRSEDWAPDVIHAHSWVSGVAGLVAQAEVPRPTVQTFQGLGSVTRRHYGDADPSPPDRVMLETAVGSRARRVIARSTDEAKELLRLGVPRGRISVIPSGVDPALFAPTGPVASRRPGLARILTVGRLAEHHGFADLVRILPHVPGAELVIVGGPPPERLDTDPAARRLRELARKIRVAGRVRLLGAVPHELIPAWYRSADVLACLRWYEPSGLATLEAMACGLPVVASRVGAHMDAVPDGVTGDLVPARDPGAAGTALRRLLEEPLRRLTYATAAVERVRRHYSWSRTAAQTVAVYQVVRDREPVPASRAVAR